MRRFFLVLGLCMLMLSTAFAEKRQVVMKDGSTVEAVSVVLVRGQVQVKLENGRFMAFDATDVDLEASGLQKSVSIPEAGEFEEPAASSGGTKGRFGAAIARQRDEKDALKITDQDVKHIHPEDEADTEDETQEESTVSLDVSGLNQVLKDGILTVTGNVTNSGTEDVNAIGITAIAEDADSKPVAQGATGISAVLKAGESRSFAIAMAVTSPVAKVRVSTHAASVTPASQPKTASSESSEGEPTP